MIKWPSIDQFRNVVRNVTQKARYKGTDENGEAIFDPYAKLPTLRFEGTVKLHGTNAAVGMSYMGDIWCQSRSNIITPQDDNAGFAMFIEANKFVMKSLMMQAYLKSKDPFADVMVFGEWCGGNIQKGVAITGLPKMFVIFGIALVGADEQKQYFTRTEVEALTVGLNSSHAGQIFCIYNYEQYVMDIDFETPHNYQNGLNEITLKVEKQCPVGAAFGNEGIGEGVCWRCVTPGFEDSGFWFKVKGDEHSNSKVKTLATVDVERINNINQLAAKLANKGRLDQGIQEVFNTLNGGEIDIKRTGEFIKWTMTDVFKEEMDTIAASGFTGKDLNGPISKMARDFLMQNLEV